MHATISAFILTGETQTTTKGLRYVFYARSPEMGIVKLCFDSQEWIYVNAEDKDVLCDITPCETIPMDLYDQNGLEVFAIRATKDNGSAELHHSIREKELSKQDDFMQARSHELFIAQMNLKNGLILSGPVKELANYPEFHNPQIRPAEVGCEFRSLSYDIENFEEELFSIAVHYKGAGPEVKKVFMITDEYGLLNEDTYCFTTEKELLDAFCEQVLYEDPDVIIGWNIINYDFPQLEKYARNNYMGLNISREECAPVCDIRKPNFLSSTIIKGRIVLDGYFLFDEAGYSFKNRKLETVAQEILQEGKLIDSEDGKLEEILRQFREDKEMLARYNLQDTVLVTNLFEAAKMFEFSIERMRISGNLCQSQKIPAATADAYFLSSFHEKKLCLPPDKERGAPQVKALFSTQKGKFDRVLEIHNPEISALLFSLFKVGMKTGNIFGDEAWSADEILFPSIPADCLGGCEIGDPRKRAWQNTIQQCFNSAMNSGSRFFLPMFTSLNIRLQERYLTALSKACQDISAQVIAYDEKRLFISINNDEDPKHTYKRFSENLSTELGLDSSINSMRAYHESILFLPRKNDKSLRFAYLDSDGLQTENVLPQKRNNAEINFYYLKEAMREILQGQDIVDFTRNFLETIPSGAFDHLLYFTNKIKHEKLADEELDNDPPALKAARLLGKMVYEVKYVMTIDGPVPKELKPKNPHYETYRSSLNDWANTLLTLADTSVDKLYESQEAGLFDFG